MKKLRIEIELQLSDDEFEGAQQIVESRPLIEAIEQNLPHGAKMRRDVIVARGPRKAKPSA